MKFLRGLLVAMYYILEMPVLMFTFVVVFVYACVVSVQDDYTFGEFTDLVWAFFEGLGMVHAQLVYFVKYGTFDGPEVKGQQ